MTDRREIARVRAGDPLTQHPEAVADSARGRALLAAIVTTDPAAESSDASAPIAAERIKRPHRHRGLAALAAAAIAAGTAVAATTWGPGDLPSFGGRSDAFVLPESRLLPAGYLQTTPPRYRDLPVRPALQFPAGVTYRQALARYQRARLAGAPVPAGVALAAPLPWGIAVRIDGDGVALDPAAPLGYDPATGLVRTLDHPLERRGATPALARCQLLLPADDASEQVGCPTPPTRLPVVREVSGRWVAEPPWQIDRQQLPVGPTTIALLERPPRRGDRLSAMNIASMQLMDRELIANANRWYRVPAYGRARRGAVVGGAEYHVVPASGRRLVLISSGMVSSGQIPLGASVRTVTDGSRDVLASEGAIVAPAGYGSCGEPIRPAWGVAADGYRVVRTRDGRRFPIRDNVFVLGPDLARGRVTLEVSGPAGSRTVRFWNLRPSC